MSYIKKIHTLVGDFHCHSLASVHAYSTIGENIEAAKVKGLKALAITDHAIGTEDSPSLSYFENLPSLPKVVDGVRVLTGVEANIMNFKGEVDMPVETLKKLDIVIASYHTSCTTPGTVQQHTESYLQLAKNPYINIIGHAGTENFAFDYEKVVPVLGEAKKVFEINDHTFKCRKKSISNCITIAKLCKKYGFRIMVNSDAHSKYDVGSCDNAFAMLEDIKFPEELIININEDRIAEYLNSINVLY